jgi:hypothetical protein
MSAVTLEIEALLSSFRIEEEGMRQLLKGPVAADLTRRAIRVQNAAKRFARGEGSGPHVRTGRLWGSITYRLGVDALSPYVDIGTSVYYAPFVEFGHENKAHAYPLVTPGGSQVVTKSGSVAFGYVSNKPTRPYPFLRPAAQAARSI